MMHNEMTHMSRIPEQVFSFCESPPREGGQTAIALTFSWQKGGVLCIDDLSCQHGRLPFPEDAGRRILTNQTVPA